MKTPQNYMYTYIELYIIVYTQIDTILLKEK